MIDLHISGPIVYHEVSHNSLEAAEESQEAYVQVDQRKEAEGDISWFNFINILIQYSGYVGFCHM